MFNEVLEREYSDAAFGEAHGAQKGLFGTTLLA
jgi:hypothetical protein